MSEIIRRCDERYFTATCDRSSFPNHNPLDTRIVEVTDYIHKGKSILNPGLQVVVKNDLLYRFAIAEPIKNV